MKQQQRATPRRRGFSIVPFLGDLVVLTRLLRDSQASAWLKLIAVATLAYVISPIDAVPDALLPILGWVDDVGLVLMARALLHTKLERYRYPLFERPPAAAEIAVTSPARDGQFASG